MLEPALYERIKDIPVKLRISFAVSNLNTQETQDVVISDDKFTVKNLGLCVLWNDNRASNAAMLSCVIATSRQRRRWKALARAWNAHSHLTTGRPKSAS